MRIKLIVLGMLALFCGSFAYATPILYTFTNNSNFTLAGINYTAPYLSDPGPRLMLTMYADTDNVVTSGDFYTDIPGSQFITNRSGFGVVSYGGVVLATLTDPVELIIDTDWGVGYLLDVTNQSGLITAYTGSYDGVSNDPGERQMQSLPAGSFDTSLGELTITGFGEETTFEASLAPTSPVPEPSSVIFLGTGALGLLGLLRHRLLVT